MLQVCATVELVWRDESESTAVTTLYLPSSLEHTELEAAADAVASSFVALTGAVLDKVRFKYRSAPFDPVVAGSSPITKTGSFFFDTTPDAPIGLVVVHAIADEVLISDGPTAGYGIDLSNSAVVAFADAVLSLPFTTPFADDFTALVAAYTQSRV